MRFHEIELKEKKAETVNTSSLCSVGEASSSLVDGWRGFIILRGYKSKSLGKIFAPILLIQRGQSLANFQANL